MWASRRLACWLAARIDGWMIWFPCSYTATAFCIFIQFTVWKLYNFYALFTLNKWNNCSVLKFCLPAPSTRPMLYSKQQRMYQRIYTLHSEGTSYRLPLRSDVRQVPPAIIYGLYPHRLVCPPTYVRLITPTWKNSVKCNLILPIPVPEHNIILFCLRIFPAKRCHMPYRNLKSKQKRGVSI